MNFLKGLLPRKQPAIARLREALRLFNEEHPKARLGVEGDVITVQLEPGDPVPPDIFEHADQIQVSLPNGGVRVLK